MSFGDSIVAYVRNLIGLGGNTYTKRDRADDGLSDDEVPAYKRHKLGKTVYPDMSSKDARDIIEEPKQKSKVRYVPIQLDTGHPSTSTPNEMGTKFSRVRAVPIQVVRKVENGPSTPGRKPRMHTPVRPPSRVVEIDDDDEEPEIWVQAKSGTKKIPKIYIDLDEEEDDSDSNENDEVQFVKKITSPPPRPPYKYFDSQIPTYKKLNFKVNDRNSMSPKPYNKLSGITKSYKKVPTSKWMAPNFPRNRFLGLNGNTRSTMAEVFNLDEKKNYQELIKKVADSIRPARIGRSFDFINLSEEAESFRKTQRDQRRALNEINLLEKGLIADNDMTKEYNPITVASINSSDSEVEVIPSESTSTTSSSRIEPINTLRDSYRDKAVTSTDWLSKLDSKYKKKKQLTQEKLKDAKRESDIISKVNSEQKIAQLEHKLKHELCIPECIYEEPQPTVELPALTPEQEKLVNRALGPGPPGLMFIEKFNLRIHKRDLQTLAGLNWLNDEVINFYMNLLMQRCEERKDLPRVYAANTFFYPKLMQGGQAGLRRWTRKVDIFAHDLMILPVHLGVHWCLSIVDFRAKTISYLDSMGGPNRACLEALMQYLKDEHNDKKGQPFDDSGWKSQCLKEIPQQMNGSDCGMFACTFAEFSARDAPYTFTQAHMPYLRRKMALEIITGKLLL